MDQSLFKTLETSFLTNLRDFMNIVPHLDVLPKFCLRQFSYFMTLQLYAKNQRKTNDPFLRSCIVLLTYRQTNGPMDSENFIGHLHCINIARISSYSGPCFPSFGLNISPYLISMSQNKDQNNSEYGHFSRSASLAQVTNK